MGLEMDLDEMRSQCSRLRPKPEVHVWFSDRRRQGVRGMAHTVAK